MIRFPDRDPTGFCNSEPDLDRTRFRNKLNRIRYGYPKCIDHCSKMLNQSFFLFKPDWIKYLDRSTGLGSDRITQWKFWTGLGLQKSPICSTLLLLSLLAYSTTTFLHARCNCQLLSYCSLMHRQASCGSSLLKKKNSTRLGQLRESTGEFGQNAQGTPKLTIKKLRPARFRSTSRSVLLSDESVFTHGFINTALSTATFIFWYKQQEFTIAWCIDIHIEIYYK